MKRNKAFVLLTSVVLLSSCHYDRNFAEVSSSITGHTSKESSILDIPNQIDAAVISCIRNRSFVDREEYIEYGLSAPTIITNEEELSAFQNAYPNIYQDFYHDYKGYVFNNLYFSRYHLIPTLHLHDVEEKYNKFNYAKFEDNIITIDIMTQYSEFIDCVPQYDFYLIQIPSEFATSSTEVVLTRTYVKL